MFRGAVERLGLMVRAMPSVRAKAVRAEEAARFGSVCRQSSTIEGSSELRV